MTAKRIKSRVGPSTARSAKLPGRKSSRKSKTQARSFGRKLKKPQQHHEKKHQEHPSARSIRSLPLVGFKSQASVDAKAVEKDLKSLLAGITGGVKPIAKVEKSAETKHEPKPELKPESKPESKFDVKLDVKHEAKPEAKLEVEPEVKLEVKPEVKPDVKPEAKPEAKPEVKPESKPEVKQEVLPEVKPEVEAEVKPEVQPEVEVDVEEEEVEYKPEVEPAKLGMPLSDYAPTQVSDYKESEQAEEKKTDYTAAMADNYHEYALGPTLDAPKPIGPVISADKALVEKLKLSKKKAIVYGQGVGTVFVDEETGLSPVEPEAATLLDQNNSAQSEAPKSYDQLAKVISDAGFGGVSSLLNPQAAVNQLAPKVEAVAEKFVSSARQGSPPVLAEVAKGVVDTVKDEVKEVAEVKDKIVDKVADVGEHVKEGVEKVKDKVEEKVEKKIEKVEEKVEQKIEKKLPEVTEKPVVVEIEKPKVEYKKPSIGYEKPAVAYEKPVALSYPVYQSPVVNSLSKKCHFKLNKLKVVLRQLSKLIRKLSRGLFMMGNVSYMTSDVVFQRLVLIKQATDQARLAANVGNLPALNASARTAGLELSRLAANKICLDLEPKLREFLKEFRSAYVAYRKGCHHH